MNCIRALSRHVGADTPENESVAFEDKTQLLVVEPSEQQGAPAMVDAAIDANPTGLGYGA